LDQPHTSEKEQLSLSVSGDTPKLPRYGSFVGSCEGSAPMFARQLLAFRS
jgi:hypothetical protein